MVRPQFLLDRRTRRISMVIEGLAGLGMTLILKTLALSLAW